MRGWLMANGQRDCWPSDPCLVPAGPNLRGSWAVCWALHEQAAPGRRCCAGGGGDPIPVKLEASLNGPLIPREAPIWLWVKVVPAAPCNRHGTRRR